MKRFISTVVLLLETGIRVQSSLTCIPVSNKGTHFCIFVISGINDQTSSHLMLSRIFCFCPLSLSSHISPSTYSHLFTLSNCIAASSANMQSFPLTFPLCLSTYLSLSVRDSQTNTHGSAMLFIVARSVGLIPLSLFKH